MAFAGTAERRFFFCADGDASWLVVDGGAKKNGGRSPPANAKVLSPPIGRSPEALAGGNLRGMATTSLT